jgi:hypothetical protein
VSWPEIGTEDLNANPQRYMFCFIPVLVNYQSYCSILCIPSYCYWISPSQTNKWRLLKEDSYYRGVQRIVSSRFFVHRCGVYDPLYSRVWLYSSLEEAVVLGLRYDIQNMLCPSFVFDERANQYDVHVETAQGLVRIQFKCRGPQGIVLVHILTFPGT